MKMENQPLYRPTTDALARLQVVHFGKICFNLEIATLVVMLLGFLSIMISAAVMLIYYLVLFVVLIGSMFLILFSEDYRKLWSGGDVVTKIADAVGQAWPYILPATMVLALLSVVCLCFDKHQKHFVRIGISVAVFVVLLFFLPGVLSDWGLTK